MKRLRGSHWRAACSWRDAGSPGPLGVNERDGSVLVYVPEGEFKMGEGPEARDVHLDAYWIGLYCVTQAQYAKFVAESKRESKADADSRTHPVVNVSWDDARAYAEWAGLRLATEAQWEKAARGPFELIYPWGEHWDASKARHEGSGGKMCSVYAYAEGVSGYGTYQQSGNVWEWCADLCGDTHRSLRKPRLTDESSFRVIRGGSWNRSEPVVFQAAHRSSHSPRNPVGYRSFRLVRAAC